MTTAARSQSNPEVSHEPGTMDSGEVKALEAGVLGSGLRVRRRFTRVGTDPLTAIPMETRRSVITDPDGSVVFEMKAVEVPKSWSQLATDILVSKYFRKAGVPGVPGHETSAAQVVRRIVRAIRASGERQGGYFTTPADAQAFEDELAHLLIHQMGAFNSPVWFNCGLAEAYGIRGDAAGCWAWDEAQGEVVQVGDAYSRPQVSACFIQSIGDDLMDIAAGIEREMRLFKFGSGTGSNFSAIRGKGEPLSGGGTSSGLMSFLEVFDRAAGAIKSGGTTRRAAKMVVLDMDHPDIEEFIDWKSREEDKVRALVAAGYSADFNGEAYRTVSGQNSNNSVRATDAFMQAVVDGGAWTTTWRKSGAPARTYEARQLMRKISEAAWRCADPGMQFDTTCNRWNTVAATERINATNPCVEFSFVDDTACNLASVNLLTFLGEDGAFDLEGYQHACKVFSLAQEILVDHASYPSARIARRSHDYRPLGLGYANLGSLLTVLGLSYESSAARAVCGALTAIMTGTAYETSARIAASKGAFPGFAHNRESMLGVIRLHREAAQTLPDALPELWGGTTLAALTAEARACWDRALRLGELHGYRNAQMTVLAPTGTIGLLMDCDTTGIEPDFALVKFKKLAGGGSFKIVNGSVSRALRGLGYAPAQVEDILVYLRGTWRLSGTALDRSRLRGLGLSDEELDRVEAALPGAFEVRHAFSRHVLGEETYRRLAAARGWGARAEEPGFDLLDALGFTAAELEAAGEVIGGRLTLEGAPHLRPEHLPIFDCANRCGRRGTRAIAPRGHLHMMAAAQPFLSGAISKTVNLPHETTVEEVERVYIEAWQLGLKAVALYRDGSKASQVLRTTAKEDDGKTEAAPTAQAAAPQAAAPQAPAAPLAQIGAPERVLRRRLPKKRRGFTQEARVGGQKVYLRTGEYEDGTLGELFIDMHKEGAALRSMMNCFAISVSLGLQHGVPLEEFVEVFTFTRFEPQGRVQDHPNIKSATSVVDYLFRVLGLEYLDRTDFVHVQPEAGQNGAAASAAAHAASPSAPTGRSPAQPATKALSGGDALASELMGDAPFCGDCGHLTVRNGSCYRCHNCGASMGCS
ncbi:MAG: vitamin B12-dependent ribonucleotide reductase [Planctomycetota bacterium]